MKRSTLATCSRPARRSGSRSTATPPRPARTSSPPASWAACAGSPRASGRTPTCWSRPTRPSWPGTPRWPGRPAAPGATARTGGSPSSPRSRRRSTTSCSTSWRSAATRKVSTFAREGVVFPITIRNNLPASSSDPDANAVRAPAGLHLRQPLPADHQADRGRADPGRRTATPPTPRSPRRPTASSRSPPSCRPWTGDNVGQPFRIEVQVTQNGTTGWVIALGRRAGADRHHHAADPHRRPGAGPRPGRARRTRRWTR